MPKRLLIAVLALAFVGLPVAPSQASNSLAVGDVHFERQDDGGGSFIAYLYNSKILRRWDATDYGSGPRVVSKLLMDRTTGRDWIDGVDSSDFTIALAGASIANWNLRSLVPSPLGAGIELRFIFDPVATTVPGGIWLERIVTLHEGAAVFDIRMILHNETPLPILISAYSLDEVWPELGHWWSTAEVQRYVGGSDWRDDFREITTHTGRSSFDVEGEVLRFENRFAQGEGWFFVSERRGGATSRVGRSGPDDLLGGLQRTWIGADYARDLLDLGPLADQPPDYNRVENPAYPVPVRARKVLPLSTLNLGRVATGVYHGGAEQAAANYVDWLTRYRQPAFPRQVLLNSFHPWSHSPDFNEATMQKQADVAATLGIDTIILDDQWQGGPGGESGDWHWDTTDADGDVARFPDRDQDGKADIADYFAAKGIKMGLWMSPAEFNTNSATFNAHPEWACTPIGTITSQVPDDAGLGVWDFTNPDLRAYMTSVVDRIVNDWGVHYFKFDFQTWVDCPPHDYNDYEDAFAAWADSLSASHPDVTFTFDETNDQRMYAFESVARGPSWFDNRHGHTLPDGTSVTAPSQVLHDVWMAAPWIPPSTLGIGLYDGGVLGQGYTPDYLMPMAALTHMTFWTDLTKLTAEQHADTKWWLDWYHAHANELGSLIYRLSDADPWDDDAPAAFQPWSATTDSGFLFAFRQNGEEPLAKLQGLIASHSYTLTNVRDGSILGTFTASQLTAGITLSLGVHRATVYSLTPV